MNPGINGGDFVFYPHGPTGEKVSFQPKYNTGIFLDGTKTAHGVEPFEPKAIPIGGQTHTTKELRLGFLLTPPFDDKFSNVDNKIVTKLIVINIDDICDENRGRYAGDKAWNFYENDEIKGQFKEEDMRLGVVWRELCLENHQV